MTDPDRLKGYKLLKDSPAINAGKSINDNGGKDFSGSPLNGPQDIGAFKFQIKLSTLKIRMLPERFQFIECPISIF